MCSWNIRKFARNYRIVSLFLEETQELFAFPLISNLPIRPVLAVFTKEE